MFKLNRPAPPTQPQPRDSSRFLAQPPPVFISVAHGASHHASDTGLNDDRGATDAGHKRDIDGGIHGRDTVTGTVHDRIHLGMNNQVVFGWTLQAFGPIIHSAGQAVVTGRQYLLVRANDDGTDTTGRVFAQPAMWSASSRNRRSQSVSVMDARYR